MRGSMEFYHELSQMGERAAVVTETGEQITYCELEEICRQIGALIEKRKVAFLLCENSVGAFVWYIAFLYNGVVPLLLDKNMKPELLEQLICTYEPDYLCRPAKMTEIKEAALHEQSGYVLCGLPGKKGRRLPQELALLLSTSGSTGSSKLVRQSYKNISSNAETIAGYLKIGEKDRAVTTLPMNYTYGLSVINSHLSAGASILITNRSVMEKEFWQAIREQGVTNINGVPYTWDMMDKLRFFRMELPALRLIVCGGGKLTASMHEKMAAYAMESGKEFVVRYGQTESTANMAYLPSNMAADKVGSIGRAIPGGCFELWDESGRVIMEKDTIGELVYKGDNVTLGYAVNAEELEKGDEFGGVLLTGDMARYDKDGCYYIVGRKKRFLKMYGNRVNLDETERLIAAAFPETDCACTGVDDHMMIYVTNEGKAEAIRDYTARITRIHKSAFCVCRIEAIPRNEAGKVLYSRLDKE